MELTLLAITDGKKHDQIIGKEKRPPHLDPFPLDDVNLHHISDLPLLDLVRFRRHVGKAESRAQRVYLALHRAGALLGPARGARPAEQGEVLGDLLLEEDD